MTINQEYAKLFTLGNVIPIGDMQVDIEQYKQEVAAFENNWRQYNTAKPWIKRQGLSLTSLDGGLSGDPDLESFRDHFQLTGIQYFEHMFTVPTPAYTACTSLHKIFNMFDPVDIGRSHILKFGAGGFFPWHRDGIGMRPITTFRVLVPLTNSTDNWIFLLENERIQLTPGKAYVINTRLKHSVFSFVENSTQLIINVDCNERSVLAVSKQLNS